MCESCHAIAPYFNFPDKKGGIRCAGCQLPGMENVVAKKCACGCKKIPTFGWPLDTAPSHCSSSKDLKMIDLKHPSCRWTDNDGSNRCLLHPSFNHPSMDTPIYCSQHATDEMWNIRNKSYCPGIDATGCRGRSTYNLSTEEKGIYCYRHKTNDMVNVKDRKCVGNGTDKCQSTPSYNYSGLKPIYCKEHKKYDMIRLVIARRCQETINEVQCTKAASFNILGEMKPIYCKEHKKADMTDVKHPRCEKCALTATFNYKGERTPLRCSNHIEPDMVSVKHRYCEHESNCPTIASFNHSGMKPKYCSAHSLPGMIIIGQKHCEELNCIDKAKYNYPGETIKRFCEIHKLTDMVNLENEIKTCIEKDCKNIPLYNLPGKKPVKCGEHFSPGMINISESKFCSEMNCAEPSLASINNMFFCEKHYPDQTAIANFKHECSICDLAPNNLVCSNCKAQRHKKEWQVVCYLKKKINMRPMLDTNQPVSECSKRRPDVYYEGLKHVVIVEIDEGEHRRIQSECECARMSEIVGSIGGKSVIFIRFNPDQITSKGRKIIIPATERLES